MLDFPGCAGSFTTVAEQTIEPSGPSKNSFPDSAALSWKGVCTPTARTGTGVGSVACGVAGDVVVDRLLGGLVGVPHPVRVPEVLDDGVDVVLGLTQPLGLVPVLPVAALPLVEVDPVFLEPVLQIIRNGDLVVRRLARGTAARLGARVVLARPAGRRGEGEDGGDRRRREHGGRGAASASPTACGESWSNESHLVIPLGLRNPTLLYCTSALPDTHGAGSTGRRSGRLSGQATAPGRLSRGHGTVPHYAGAAVDGVRQGPGWGPQGSSDLPVIRRARRRWYVRGTRRQRSPPQPVLAESC